MATSQAIKEVQRAGILITKDKLLDLIKRSPNQSFTYSQSLNTKEAIVIVSL